MHLQLRGGFQDLPQPRRRSARKDRQVCGTKSLDHKASLQMPGSQELAEQIRKLNLSDSSDFAVNTTYQDVGIPELINPTVFDIGRLKLQGHEKVLIRKTKPSAKVKIPQDNDGGEISSDVGEKLGNVSRHGSFSGPKVCVKDYHRGSATAPDTDDEDDEDEIEHRPLFHNMKDPLGVWNTRDQDNEGAEDVESVAPGSKSEGPGLPSETGFAGVPNYEPRRRGFKKTFAMDLERDMQHLEEAATDRGDGLEERDRLGIELISYARKGDLLGMRHSIEQGVPVDYCGMANDDDRDINVLSRNYGAATALHHAASMGEMEAVRQLLSLGASIDARNAYGGTPLHYAVYWGFWQVSEVLLENGAHIDAVNECLWTPLHHAVQHQNPGCAEMLLAHGANPNLVNDDGESPLDLATRKKHEAQVAVLREYGARAPEDREFRATGADESYPF
eukprot:CAMPEP_0184309344 /NCGR_PEP_ID=MMETSP1049-20130417/17535_1 /TAXON_ID=77928 /ORGANISM="Proteomonas sulcata, Strain CCMP704" /LENGTH=446 /DNA_ID=CAMNT_0026622219 /DNA_START=21 /DNA_END=1361 /DNA_ORIENTATION=-